MPSLSRKLVRQLKRLTRLHNREIIVIDHPNWCKSKPLTGRIIGWSFDIETDDEPLIEVRYSSDLPKHWSEQTDYIHLAQIQLANEPLKISTCQRSLVRA
jgi:hypothetical protein